MDLKLIIGELVQLRDCILLESEFQTPNGGVYSKTATWQGGNKDRVQGLRMAAQIIQNRIDDLEEKL